MSELGPFCEWKRAGRRSGYTNALARSPLPRFLEIESSLAGARQPAIRPLDRQGRYTRNARGCTVAGEQRVAERENPRFIGTS
jgi:hypothetical protein